jgi:hypothetical protein
VTFRAVPSAFLTVARVRSGEVPRRGGRAGCTRYEIARRLLALAVLSRARHAQPTLQAELVRRYEAPEANQGVAVDERSIYAIGNSEIGRYDKQTGKRTGGWSATRRSSRT